MIDLKIVCDPSYTMLVPGYLDLPINRHPKNLRMQHNGQLSLYPLRGNVFPYKYYEVLSDKVTNTEENLRKE